MSTRDNYKKTLRFSDETDEKLGKLADKCGLSKFQFFNLMVEYFHRTKKDPRDVNDEMLKSTLLKNHDTYIRFIRAQEEKILIPVKTEIDRMIQSQLKIIDFFNTRVLKANTDQADRQEQFSQKLRETVQLLKLIVEKTDTKENLKVKFLYILNTYIKTREAFGFTSSAKDKDDLIQLTRQQIAKL
ncbi:BfmA/BtgA family mobilization protein [Mucilaginibacter sp. cycad4]|uniref:BfmA/BtgA family mobilization protein n=1 Tax=Mucilaginibacter sp. cycad4 TaxID=3342096 RepID=UPI002AAC2DD8|nr:BfmA/BtgA family mobilization protein [Mucilaginibacter gossypii]WPV02109.1 BfmA/BtgA family mobilization protein [Mucilaginibacter gossypii]